MRFGISLLDFSYQILCIPKFPIRNPKFEINSLCSMPYALRHAQLTEPATLPIIALVWFAKTGSISIFDLLGVNVEGNAFTTDPAAEIFCGLIHDPGPVTLHADISHFSISP